MNELDISKRFDAIESLLRKVLSPDGKLYLNMTAEEIIISISGKTAETINITTDNIENRIMFCAIVDLKMQPFGWTEISRCLDNRGWHVGGKSTMGNAFTRLTSKGWLMRENEKYRLPSKVRFVGDALKEDL